MTAFPEKATPQSSPEDQRGSRKNMIDGPVWWRKIADLFLTHKNTWIVFFLLAFMYAYFYHEPGYNGNSRLSLTAAIAEEGRLAIDSFHEVSGYATEGR